MRPSTFDLYLFLHPGGHGVQGAWGPQLAMNRFLSLLATQIPTLWIHTSGGGGGGALILNRCRAFDLFASVDAHLWTRDTYFETGDGSRLPAWLPERWGQKK
jgi:hypothetical protein